MARLTVEDCLDHVDNRFNLVLLASRRARQLGLGASPLVTADKDKPTVLALREIAEGRITQEMLDAEEARLPKPQKVPEYQYTPDDFNE